MDSMRRREGLGSRNGAGMELILGYSSRIAAIVDCLVVSAIALADSFVPRPAPHPTPEVTQAVAHWSTQQKNTVRWAHSPVYPTFWNAPLGPNHSVEIGRETNKRPLSSVMHLNSLNREPCRCNFMISPELCSLCP
jgi:hypothetical protein